MVESGSEAQLQYKFPALAVLVLLGPGCRDKDSDPETGAVDSEDSTETGTDSTDETGGDTSGSGEIAREGFALCAGGGWVTGADVQGVTCTAPLDVAGISVRNDDLVWQPGPITLIAP